MEKASGYTTASGGGWRDAEPGNTFPDWVEVDFNGSKTIDEVDVFSVQDSYGVRLSRPRQ